MGEVTKLTTIDRTHTAIHEAGHAVACVRLWETGRVVERVTIDRTGSQLGSHLAEEITFPADEPETAEQRREFENEAIYSCAGYAALIAAGYDEATAVLGCDPDFDIADYVTEEPLAEIKQEAVALMQRPKNIKAVSRVAEELLQRTTLDPLDVEVLIEIADGDATEDDYQTYLILKAKSETEPP